MPSQSSCSIARKRRSATSGVLQQGLTLTAYSCGGSHGISPYSLFTSAPKGLKGTIGPHPNDISASLQRGPVYDAVRSADHFGPIALFRFLLLSLGAWLLWRFLTAFLRGLFQQRPPPAPPPPPPPSSTSVQELVSCPVCNVWRTKDGLKPCGRADCPY